MATPNALPAAHDLPVRGAPRPGDGGDGGAMAEAPRILFCPFCRECYEGETRCPEHELALVPFEKLPRNAEDAAADLPRDDEDVSPFDGRFGRAIVAAGALTLLASFGMTFVDIVVQGDATGFSGLEAASGRAPNLWTVPFVGVVLLAILGRRRTLAKMRSARLSMILLAVAPLFAIGYSYLHVLEGAAAASTASHAMQVTPGLGIVVAGIGTLIAITGARKLGVTDVKGLGPMRADLDARSPIAPDRDA